jgi:predicted membrane protein
VPRAPAVAEIETLRRRLADEWIGGQISYHARARGRHERRGLVLTALVLVCFFGALAFAIVHATTTALEVWAIRFSVALPVAAAALGVILTVRQHRALAERYHRMEGDLVAVRRSLHAADAETLAKVTSEAARIVAEENGDWFGAMWFLDVEHPP